MLKSRIISFALLTLLLAGLSFDANAATQTTESCTEENAEKIQQEQSDSEDKGGVWALIWGSEGYF